MTTANSVELHLKRLDELRARCPELRFGQLIATIGMLAEDETGHSLWDIEDADFASALERFAADMARRGSNAGAERGNIRSTTAVPAPQSPRQIM